MRHRVWVALAAASAVAICGCGGGSASASRLRSQARQICSATNKRTGRIPRPTPQAGGRTFLARGTSALAVELRQLELLRAPRQDAASYAAALSALSSELVLLRQAERSLAEGSDPVLSFQALQQRLAPLEQKADSAWSALGIPSCSDR